MYNIAASIILTILFVIITIVSEKYNLTVLASFKKLFTLVKDLCKSLSAEKAVASYPVGLGYDGYGRFWPSVIDKIFEPMQNDLECLAYSHHDASLNNVLLYEFRFIRINTQSQGITLYDYIDSKVKSIITQEIHAHQYDLNCSDDLSAIYIDTNTLKVYIAKNFIGEKEIASIRETNRNNIINTNINQNQPKGPININWQQLQQNQQNQQNQKPTQPPQPPIPPQLPKPTKQDRFTQQNQSAPDLE